MGTAESAQAARVRAVVDGVGGDQDFASTAAAITRAVTEVLGFAAAALLVRRADSHVEVAGWSGRPPAVGPVGSAVPLWRAREPERVTRRLGLFEYVDGSAPADASAAGSATAHRWHEGDLLQAPLQGPGGEVVGLLRLDRPPRGELPDRRLVDLLDLVAELASSAIRAEQFRVRLREQVRLASVGRQLVASGVGVSEHDELLARAGECLLVGMEAERVLVRLTEGEGLPGLTWRGPGPFALGQIPSMLTEVAGMLSRQAWEERCAYCISLADPDPALLPGVDLKTTASLVHDQQVEHMLLAPIGVGTTYLGHVLLMRGPDGLAFTETEGEALAAMGRDLGTAVLGTQLSITQRQYVERLTEVDRRQRNLFAMVSHELQGPLTSIAGHAEMLSDGTAGDEAARHSSVAAITRNVTRLQVLVRELLDMQRVESTTPDRSGSVDLAACLREAVDVWRVTAERDDVRIEVSSAPACRVVGDRAELERMVSNLLSNAVKYSRAGGTVTAEVCRDGDLVVVTMRDRGIGISAHDQRRLFTEFFRSSEEAARGVGGTGIGLSLVSRIVHLYGGTIEVESELGEGSVFRVALPATAE